MPEMSEQIFVTHGKGKVHIRACPHLSDTSELTPATPEQVKQNGYCSHCEKEIAGVGRKYFESLDDAFEAFGHRTDEAKGLIRKAIVGIEHDSIWIPASESYIALGVNGLGTAWIGKGYVDFRDREHIELPWFAPHSGGGVQRLDEWGDLCDVHFIERSVSAVCELCE